MKQPETPRRRHGLLLAAHGAPRDAWNDPVRELGGRVRDRAIESGEFTDVRTAMLEFVQPDIASALEELEREGCERIVAVPLFIGPSGHALFDVPAALGVLSPTLETGTQLDFRCAKPTVPVTLTETLGVNLLRSFVLDEIRRLSAGTTDEAVVCLVHGSSSHQGLLNGLLQQIAEFTRDQTRVDYVDWTYIGTGMGYADVGVPAILKAGQQHNRVLVIGLYMASSARSIHARNASRIANSAPEINELVAQQRVVHSDCCLVEYLPTADWILKAARNAL